MEEAADLADARGGSQGHLIERLKRLLWSMSLTKSKLKYQKLKIKHLEPVLQSLY